LSALFKKNWIAMIQLGDMAANNQEHGRDKMIGGQQ
jgi:hypothetical protein